MTRSGSPARSAAVVTCRPTSECGKARSVEIGRPQITVPIDAASRPADDRVRTDLGGMGRRPAPQLASRTSASMLIERLSARGDIRVRYRPHPLTGRRSPELRAAHQRILGLVGRVPPDEPIAETFAASSGLIGDVSSVINEYLPYDRPYAVIDTRESRPRRVRRAVPVDRWRVCRRSRPRSARRIRRGDPGWRGLQPYRAA